MSRLLRHPMKVKVAENSRGEPACFSRKGKRERVRVISRRWRVTEGWWRQATAREYFQVETNTGLICEIYRDLFTGNWYLHRVYD